jgi:hypothetical protein
MAQMTEMKPADASISSPSQEDPTTQLLLLATAGLSAGAAGIHFAVAPGHLAEDLLAGYFFIAVAISQTLWAILISRYSARRLLVVGALGNLVVAIVWLAARVYGLPVGEHPWTPEPVRLTDAISAAFEVAAVASVWVLCSRHRPRIRRVAGPALAIGVVLVVLTSAALLNVGMVE